MSKPLDDQILAIIADHGFSVEFPKAVIMEADAILEPDIDKTISFHGRRDLRALRVFTIDGSDARDLDDAVSIERIASPRLCDESIPSASYRLGVHIADVSYYAPPRGKIDKEAYARGSSVYLPDRVLPMLPTRLSNDLCSLNPDVDRLAVSVIMDIDKNGQVASHDIFLSVIRSVARITYDDAQAVLDRANDTTREEPGVPKDIAADLIVMRELAETLRLRRTARGALDFSLDEQKTILDEDGLAVAVEVEKATEADGIIEEFMIACNETAARVMKSAGVLFPYRTHAAPSPFAERDFTTFAQNIGIYKSKKRRTSSERSIFSDVIRKARGSPIERCVISILLRSMSKATYTHDNIGHYGLASDSYCHFTAPIRRYPDLMSHRALKEVIASGAESAGASGTASGGQNGRFVKPKARKAGARSILELKDACFHCSERERAAASAEYAVRDLLTAQFMEQFIGEVFSAVVTNVSRAGIFVSLDNLVEGRVSFYSLDDDYYDVDYERFRVIGTRTRKTITVGDPITVRLIGVNISERHIDFEPVSTAKNRNPNTRKTKPSGREPNKSARGAVNKGRAKKSKRSRR